MATSRLRRHLSRITVGFTVSLGTVGLMTLTADAAMDAQLSRGQARPGEQVTWTTVGAYDDLAAAPPQDVYMISTSAFDSMVAKGGQVCGTTAQYPLGKIRWVSGVGTLSFRVPQAPPSAYYFEVAIDKGCWRVGGGQGVLSLQVLRPLGEPAAPPDNRGWLAIALAVSCLLLAAFIALRRRGRRIR